MLRVRGIGPNNGNVGCNTSKLNTTAKVVTPEMRAVIAGIVQEGRVGGHHTANVTMYAVSIPDHNLFTQT